MGEIGWDHRPQEIHQILGAIQPLGIAGDGPKLGKDFQQNAVGGGHRIVMQGF